MAALLASIACGGDKSVEPSVPTTIVASSSTSLTGVAGGAVSPSPSILVTDQNGAPMAGVTVEFVVLSGGGSVSGSSVATNASGIATVGTWTLGATGGPNVLTASAGTLPTVTFSATATAGAAAALVKSAGDNQSATAGTAVAVPPAVTVRDSNGNPKGDVVVAFAVASGGGSVTGGTATTNAAGVATVGSWTVGAGTGTNTLTASAPGLAPVTFTAAATAGAAAALNKSAGDNQSAEPGTPVAVAPAVTVRDAIGNPTAGVVVTFAVASGGGSVTGATATTNSAGVATVGSWTLGPGAGINTLTASSPGIGTVTFTASAVAAACTARTAHVLGTTTAGALSTSDCRLSDGTFVDFFSVSLLQANAYLFRQTAAFDTYLFLATADGGVIAENDDETSTSRNSTIKALLPAGSYLLGASSFDAGVTGTYSISSSTTSTAVTRCELVYIVKNVSTTQNIEATDCLRSTPPTASIFADSYFIFLRAGQSLTVTMTSTEVDSFLELVNLDGVQVASNDDRNATTKNAQLNYTAPATSYYAIFARAAISQTGSYTLTVQ